jgi:2-methylcitrate dehydratase PrpD
MMPSSAASIGWPTRAGDIRWPRLEVSAKARADAWPARTINHPALLIGQKTTALRKACVPDDARSARPCYMTSMTALEKLGAFVAQVQLPPRLRGLLDLHIIDAVGAWIGGLHTNEGAALLRWRGTLDGAHPPPVDKLRGDIAIHCALARLSEIDDIHLGAMITPGAIVVPAAVAIAASLGVSQSPALAAAMLAGYEMMIRFGRAIDGPAVLYRGIWPTYFAAPIGVAAVASRLLGLDAQQTANALALALTRSAPGVGHHNAATTSRWLAIGDAARSGLTAAFAARAGFTADVGLLDGAFLPNVFNIKPDAAALTAALGETFALEETAFKPWCAARQTIGATQAMAEIIDQGIAPDAITAVTAFVLPPHRRMIDHGVVVGDRASFLTSLPYRLAVAALSPSAAFDVGQSPREVPANIRAFMERISIEADEALLATYPRQWPARVEVTTSSGRHMRTIIDVPGDTARPFDLHAVTGKFHQFIAPSLGVETTTRLLQRVQGLLDGAMTPAQLLKDIEGIAVAKTTKK